ncbi:MAG TPA: zf-HC2 domain-containing protein [Vicinamibacterales bacterium]|nr:zf-HC2 domain-containing protein [Vicinamibacterales bacterium]
MTCRELADFILQYLESELPAEVRRDFERHLSLCENCREYLATYKTAVEIGRRAYRDPEADAAAAGAPEDLIAAILEAVKKREGS